jgi:hypothetical protein
MWLNRRGLRREETEDRKYSAELTICLFLIGSERAIKSVHNIVAYRTH